MFKKMQLRHAIKKSKRIILALEQKRSRSQAALVEAILTHTTPQDTDVTFSTCTPSASMPSATRCTNLRMN